jgi:hypothetical protein
MSGTDWRLIRYLDSLEHEYGYMLKHTSAYVYPGWKVLIQDMLREIDTHYTGNEFPVLTEIKDKFGSLRVYGDNISDETQEIIDKYECLSTKTCMTCGAEGELRVKDQWLYVSCDRHEETR